MFENTNSIISKVWGMCAPLRDDCVLYGDYLKQLTYLMPITYASCFVYNKYYVKEFL